MVETLRQLLVSVSLHPLVTALLLAALFWGLLLATPLRRLVTAFCERHGRRALVAVSLTIVAVHLAVTVWYLLLPGFAGEVEPLISSVSWAVQSGQPLYHDFDAAEHYSILYGPMTFLTNGLFLRLFGPSLVSAKLAAVVACALALLFQYLALTALVSRRMALGFTALTVLLYQLGGAFSYKIRPDPLLIAAICFGLLSALRGGRVLAAAGVAAALGYAVNLKIHAILYFLPVLVLLQRRRGWRAVLLAGAGGAALVALPFLLNPRVSAQNYLVWLRESARHGLDRHTFTMTMQLFLFLGLPPLAFLLPGFRDARLLREQRPYLLALLGGGLGVLAFAAKPGAGLNHLLPLAPLVLLPPAVLLTRLKAGAADWRRVFSVPRLAVALAIGLAAAVAGPVTEYRCVRLTQSYSTQGKDVVQDLRRILAAYPDRSISMAYAGKFQNFQYAALRPCLVFAGQPVLLDVIAVMESDFAQRPLPARTLEAVTSGRVAIWLAPRGQEPFQTTNWYPTHHEIFPPEFRDAFRANYRCRDRSRFFDLYFHDSVPAQIGAVLDVPSDSLAGGGPAGGAGK